MFGVAEKRSFQYSMALHLGVVLLFVLGLPSVLKRADPQPMVMTVEILPISAMTNVKPSEKPIQEAKQSKNTPVNAKPIPKTAQEKPDEPEPVKKDVLTVPDPTLKKKPEEKKKKEEEEKKKADDFAALMSKLNQESKKEKTEAKPKDDTTQEENKTRSDAPYDDSLPLSISEKDMIRSQFVKCWRMPAGAPDPAQLVVRVRVFLGSDGTVTEAKLAGGQGTQYSSDTFFRAAADAALRAVWQCSPLQNLPADKYGSWRDMELTFDPQELL